MEILYLFAGLLVGSVAVYFYLVRKLNHVETGHQEVINTLENRALISESALERGTVHFQQSLQEKELAVSELKHSLDQERASVLDLSKALVQSKEAARYLEQKLEDQKLELQQTRVAFNQEFENIANRLFKEHSKEFSLSSQKSLVEVLTPLKDRIQLFENKVNEAYDKEMREKISLKEEVRQLYQLNQRISEEANNLTKALKGDVKKMGNWGEVMLERILEQSGLEKNTMYQTQVSNTDEDGKRYQPDVVVYLPDKKHVIIDAKVSLVAYEKYSNADSEEERKAFIKEHLVSVYNHVKLLSAKNYQAKAELNSPDFVLLFIPVEASFSAAIREDAAVFDYAWENKIVIVSPSTLLATLKTIQSIWKQENQNRNAQEIARQGAGLYDKFAGFLEDLQRIGSSLNMTQKAYDEAIGKLHSGRGNLVSRVENLKKLGVKPGKNLPERFINPEDLTLPFNEEQL